MNTKTLIITALISVLVAYAGNTLAQPANPKTNSRMLYHDGKVFSGTSHIYFIYYGCWGLPHCWNGSDTASMDVLSTFASTVGNSPYLQINSTYPDSTGQAPSGVVIYGGDVFDPYSHGVEITRGDVEDMISRQINNFQLPQDSQGIYVIISSADVSANDMGFCSPGAPTFHSVGIINSARLTYGFIGNPMRCPTAAGAPYFWPGGSGLTTPNGSFAGDAMVTNLAHILNTTLTNPWGNGWYDRYGLENGDKCAGMLGTTYTTSNGASANVRIGSRDYLLEQNWLNDKKGRCALTRF